MFTAALFTTAMTWKPPKCSTKKWIKTMWYIYTVGFYSYIKRNRGWPLAETWLDQDLIILSETKKDKHHIPPLIYGIFKKHINELIYKTEIDPHTQKTNFMFTQGERRRRIN